jgi:hypothetical protein
MKRLPDKKGVAVATVVVVVEALAPVAPKRATLPNTIAPTAACVINFLIAISPVSL